MYMTRRKGISYPPIIDRIREGRDEELESALIQDYDDNN